MMIRIICSTLIAVYYLIIIINHNKVEQQKKKVRVLSISLIITYIIYLVLIWIVV